MILINCMECKVQDKAIKFIFDKLTQKGQQHIELQ